MNFKTGVIAAAALSLTAGAAMAQAPMSQQSQMMGFYVGAAGGWNWARSADITQTTTGGPGITTPFRAGSSCTNGGGQPLLSCMLGGPWDLSGGLAGLGSVGYAFGNGMRLEFEASYRRNNVKDVFHIGPNHRDDASGYISQLGLMGNVAFDVVMGWPVVPYVGVGLGTVRVSAHGVQNDNAGANEIANGAAWTLGVQGFVGADYFITQALRIGLRYNYLHTTVAKDIHDRNNGGTITNNKLNIDPSNHTALLTVAYNFGAPRVVQAPAPAPAPAPALQRNFLVFFDFDKSDITPEADRVIVQAANNAKTASVTRITLTGHTDRSGPVAYNQRLSERRAESVKARLVREGIPANQIVTIGRGESQPLVPTADGVREPQNRRVEIVL